MTRIQSVDLTYMSHTKKPIDCPICGNVEHTVVSEGMSRGGISLSYVICHHCTHVYMKEVPSLDAYSQFYESGDYRRLTGDHTNTQQLASNPELFERRYSHGERLYTEYLNGILNGNDTVFDFGCGDGAWLFGLNKITGCRVSGNEPSQGDADFIKKKLGIDVFVGLIEDCADDILKAHKGGVKVAIVSGSLQHMLDPMKCLRLAHQILQEDGYLYVCNKNIFVHYISDHSPFPRYFADLRTVDHPHYFHEANYRYMLEDSGFQIVKFNNHSKIRFAHMEVLAQKRAIKRVAIPVSSYSQVLAQIDAKEKEVARFKSFPARLSRWLKRRLVPLSFL